MQNIHTYIHSKSWCPDSADKNSKHCVFESTFSAVSHISLSLLSDRRHVNNTLALADILTVIPLNGYSHWWDIWSNPFLGLPYRNSSVQDSWRDYLVSFRTPRNLLLLLWRRLHFEYLIQPTHLPHPPVWQGWQGWQQDLRSARIVKNQTDLFRSKKGHKWLKIATKNKVFQDGFGKRPDVFQVFSFGNLP